MWEQLLKDINFKQINDTWIACKYKQFQLQRNFGSNETKETKTDKALIKIRLEIGIVWLFLVKIEKKNSSLTSILFNLKKN